MHKIEMHRDGYKCTPGRRKPQVLPEPVLAMATRSRPAMATGQDCAWMGVGLAKPARLICGQHASIVVSDKEASIASLEEILDG